MVVELGQFALVLALVVALAQATVPLVGASRGDAALTAFAKPAAYVQFACIAAAFAALTFAYVTFDFSVVNVARNSHSTQPLLYRLSERDDQRQHKRELAELDDHGFLSACH